MHERRFDVFLSHHSADAPVVERVAERLRGEGIQPWLDRRSLTPGGNWQEEIIQGLRASRACAVFVGPHGLGDWTRQELAVALDRAAKDRDFRLFMVLLPGAVKPVDPSLAFLVTRTWVDLREGIDNPRGFQKLLFAITGVEPRPPAVSGASDDVCPYRGLESFDEAHAEFFFGRDHDVVRAVEKLKDSRFLAVLGPSGCGKSSLVRAGVVPALEQDALAGSEAWTIRVVTPGARPLRLLAAQLARQFPKESMQRTLEGLRADEQSLDLAVALALAERPDHERLVLVVDQFEEVFTLCADEGERAAFLANLCYAAGIPGGRLVVLLAMRADFYHRCAPYPQLTALMSAQQFLVSPLGPDGLREVIERPAWRVGLELQHGLAETILGDVVDRPGTLPLLEYVLLEVWRHRRGRVLTLEAYVASGGVEGALAQRADAIYEGLAPVQQQIARRVLLRLIQPGEGAEDTRRRAEIGELLTQPEEEVDLEEVVKALADARLLTTSRGEDSEERVVDVAHEALIRGWPRLRGWINDDRELLLAHRRLTEVASEWNANGREEGFLYRGARLAAWQDRPLEPLNNLEHTFLAASREREGRERAAKRRRVRLAVISLSVALVIISALAVQAVNQRELAFSRELAASARTQLSIDPELSLLLARRAFEVRPTAEAESVLRQATLGSRIRATLRGHQGLVYGVAFSPDGQQVASAGQDGTVRIWDPAGGVELAVLRGHQGTVWDVAFSADGRRVASAGEDGTVRIWDPAAGTQLTVLRGHQSAVRGVAFSPDGQRLASASVDRTVRIWNGASGAELAVLHGHQGAVYGVAFSPDGRQIASASGDGTVRIWDWAGKGEPVVLGGHRLGVQSVAFSPDGRRVVSAAGDGSVRIWDWAGGSKPVVLGGGHQGTVRGVAFSPDGRWVASVGDDGRVRVREWVGRGEPVELAGHQGPVYGAAFSPDGQRVASAGHDGTVRVWEWAAGADPVVLRGHENQVVAVAFSPEGQRVASAGYESAVRVWDLSGRSQPVVLTGHQGQIWGVAFSPDGQRLASAGRTDRTVRVWDLSGRSQPVVLADHQGSVWSVAFSPDGQRLASASADGTVRIWSLAGGADPVVLSGYRGVVRGVAFSSHGRVASAGDDGTVRVWDLSGGADPVVLSGHRGPVRGIAFSRDGQWVASTGHDGTVRVWEWAVAGQPVVLRGHQGIGNGVAFSPDGQLVVSAGADGTVRVWKWAGGDQPVVLRGHQGGVYGVAFSPDGQRVASVGFDFTVRVWECEVCGPIEDVLALAKERSRRELTDEERQAFLHEPARS